MKQATLEQRDGYQRITPPSGRSYNTCYGEQVEICNTCKGEGRHDSCFDCGNRGFHILD